MQCSSRQWTRCLICWMCLALAVDNVLAATPFVPNDPLYPQQWHLDKQSTGAVIDANVAAAWAKGWTGHGVRIGIIEESRMHNWHPDLAPNYDPEYDLNYPDFSDVHATNVAGVAAAKGGNGIGVTGAAPNASLSTLVVNYGSESLWAEAALHRNDAIHIKNSSWGRFAQFERFFPIFKQAVLQSETDGTINVRSAANNRSDSNKYGDKNFFGQIVVGAVGSNGVYSNYSNYGANLTVSAPSSSAGQLGITTTTQLGGYTSSFGGTSAAAPLVSGILALAKEAQPNLDVRMAKHLLARTSRMVDPDDNTYLQSSALEELLADPSVVTPLGKWRTNAAGIHFNNNYGFGLIDAGALVDAVQKYSGVTELVTYSTGTIIVGETIPEDGMLTRTFELGDYGPLEDMSFEFSLTGLFKSSVEIFLTSPAGTIGLLQSGFVNAGSSGTGGIRDWSYLTHAFWGEDGAGTWSVTMRDLPWLTAGEAENTEMWNSFGVTARFGSLISIAVPEPAGWQLWTICASVLVMRAGRIRV